MDRANMVPKELIQPFTCKVSIKLFAQTSLWTRLSCTLQIQHEVKRLSVLVKETDNFKLQMITF